MRLVYLQPNLLVHGNWPVAEGDGVAEAGLPLNGPLGQVHDDLWALRAGVEEQGKGGQTPIWLHRQAALGFVVASVGRGGPIQSICAGKRGNISLNKYIIWQYMRWKQQASHWDTYGGASVTFHFYSHILAAHVTSTLVKMHRYNLIF